MQQFALSLQQPWAELIVQGRKTIETRTWNTKFRGEFFIHASQRVDETVCKRVGLNPSIVVRGALIGKATLVDVFEYCSVEEWLRDKDKHFAGEFSRPRFGFILKDIQRITPVPMKGKLNFFKF